MKIIGLYLGMTNEHFEAREIYTMLLKESSTGQEITVTVTEVGDITYDNVTQFLLNWNVLYAAGKKAALTAGNIIKLACGILEIDMESLKTLKKTREEFYPRYLIMKLLKDHTDKSLNEIGKYFSRTHGSVIHAIRTLEADMENNARVRELYKKLEDAIVHR